MLPIFLLFTCWKAGSIHFESTQLSLMMQKLISLIVWQQTSTQGQMKEQRGCCGGQRWVLSLRGFWAEPSMFWNSKPGNLVQTLRGLCKKIDSWNAPVLLQPPDLEPMQPKWQVSALLASSFSLETVLCMLWAGLWSWWRTVWMELGEWQWGEAHTEDNRVPAFHIPAPIWSCGSIYQRPVAHASPCPCHLLTWEIPLSMEDCRRITLCITLLQ